jgi:hypothetical protein
MAAYLTIEPDGGGPDGPVGPPSCPPLSHAIAPAIATAKAAARHWRRHVPERILDSTAG